MKTEVERLQFLTRNYALLQGYPIGMAGVLYVSLGAAEMVWKEPAVILVHGWLFPVTLVVLIFAVLAAQRHYQRKYGVVKSPMESRRAIWLAVFIAIYFVLVQLGGPDFKHLKVALDPTLVNGGLILFLGGLLPGFPWRHYLPIGLALAAVGFLPAFHVMTVQQFWHGWSFIAPGIAFLLCGVIDRLIFLHMLPAAQAEEVHA
ncbi:MAG TPA: hypothetical protein VJ848_10185 [Candidatus Angelobacter sp.]|nr:hypothetical protein [Candidatus Angelobacter sp.]